MPSQREFSHQLLSPGHPSPKWFSQASKGLAEAPNQCQPAIRGVGRLVLPSFWSNTRSSQVPLVVKNLPANAGA